MDEESSKKFIYLLTFILAALLIMILYSHSGQPHAGWGWLLAGADLAALVTAVCLAWKLKKNPSFFPGLLIILALMLRFLVHSSAAAPLTTAVLDLASGVALILCFLLIYQENLTVRQDFSNIEAVRPDGDFLNIIESFPYGILTIDLQGKIIFANKAFGNIYGYEQQGIIGRFVWDLTFKEKEKEKLLNFFNRIAIEHPLPATYFMQDKTKPGKLIDLQIDWRYQKNAEEKITAVIAVITDITARKENEQKIEYLSFHDRLTGVYNRAFFEEELSRMDVERQLPISIIAGDVNSLKLINDAFGHFEGDRLLFNVSAVLKAVCRQEDVISRWGGDEFFVLLPKTGAKEVEKICSRIKSACEDFPADTVPLSISLGYATKTDKMTDIAEVIIEAENMMYQNKLLETSSLSRSILAALENKLQNSYQYSSERIQKIKSISCQFGTKLSLDDTELERLMLLARFHNLGNIGIEEEIIHKSGALTQEEWTAIKKHAEIGYHIARSSNDLLAIAEEVLAHHEHWDGSGYPRGIKGEDIPFLARVLAIVDAYVAMTDANGYKEPRSHTEALEEIKRSAGSHFDPALVDVFVRMFADQAIAAQ